MSEQLMRCLPLIYRNYCQDEIHFITADFTIQNNEKAIWDI